MKIRYQADADLKQLIVKSTLRSEPTIDFQTATDANLEGLPDPEVLRQAAVQQRILVSHDQRTMPSHFAEFITKEVSAGLIIAPQHLPIPIVVEHLILIWATEEPAQWINRIIFLPL